MEQIIQDLSSMFPQLNAYFYAGVIVFCRLAGFVRFAPVFHRNDVITYVKIGFVFLFTILITPNLNPPSTVPSGTSLGLMIILNIFDHLGSTLVKYFAMGLSINDSQFCFAINISVMY